MSTMNISLLETLKTSVDLQVSQRGYGTSSEHVHEKHLIGAGSAPTAPVSGTYFDGLRDRVHQATSNNTLP